ncbi:T9SS type A sorting domain-containing protein [Hymenobacter setariae]|uniref:T9SS type A sorting domain-containing protein n=1 Tax=Hymenobacter setariae TaxID=2594794 RepID=A0A558C1M5_9BACT|nr:T9SS type A sorting domain-containing protein [Hymenobacter setariae]
MFNFTLRLRSSFLGLLLAGFAALPCAAQNQVQARSYSDSPTFNTVNPDQAVDESLATAATLKPTLIGGAALRVTFPAAIQPGQQAMLYVKPASGVLDASVLGRMVIRTYTSKVPTQMQQEVSLTDNSVNVNLLPGNDASNKISFTATQPFDQLELRVGALLNVSSNVDVYAVYGTVSPLPVQLTTFQGQTTTTGVALKWETASEQNTDYFEVQRAESPSSNYSSLGQVKSAGTSTQARKYQFVDAHATGLHYYRLRQVDATGAETFSPVVTVDAGLVASLSAYPTLATSVVNVTGRAGTHLSVFDQQGQQVQVADISASQRQQLDVSNLPSGMYFLRDAATGQSARFIKSSGR